MRDVARAADVSMGTVSRVINNNRTVNPEIRARVLKAAETLGFVPDSIAQSMRMRNTGVVGCMVSDVANPLFSAIVGAAEKSLHEASYNLVLANSYNRIDLELEILTLFKRRRLDGLIAGLSSETDDRLVDAVRNLGVPTVLIERDLPTPMDAVLSDHYSGTLQATKYLLTMGHRRIGLITVPESTLPGRQRAAAYRDAHVQAGLPVDESLVRLGSFSRALGYDAAYQMLLSAGRPSALMAGSAEMIGVLKVTRLLEIRIPEQLSLIVFGDSDLAELHTPSLTAIRWEPDRTGHMAANLLLSRLRGDAPETGEQRIRLSTELLVRRSCAPAAAPAEIASAPRTSTERND